MGTAIIPVRTPTTRRRSSSAAKGYLDFHLSLVGPGVAHQYLVYAKSGHFTEMVPVAESGCLTLYRLPFWHYTTPLQAKPEQERRRRAGCCWGRFCTRTNSQHLTFPYRQGRT